MPANIETIPARRGAAVRVTKGQSVKVINTHGEQVVDTWAFNTVDVNEFMSMEATRATLLKMRPAVGDSLYTNRRRAILTVVEDTDYHDNCSDNLRSGTQALGVEVPTVPSPLNLFMNIPWTASGELAFEAPVTAPGDYIVLRAEMDAVVAFSACPQDILPINGQQTPPTEAHYQVIT